MSLFHLVLVISILSVSSFPSVENGTIHKVGLKKVRHQHTLSGIQSKLLALRTLSATANVTLKDVQDMYYYGDVSLGTPEQTFRIMFDSGSADLWLGSYSICTNTPSFCSYHSVYNPTASSTYQKVGLPFAIQYGKGEVSGVVSIDNFEVAGLKVTDQSFGEATYVDSDTADSDFDGILGLAYTDLSSMGVNPPFVNMINQGVVEQPVFAFYLNNVGEDTSDGELVIGGTDPNHYTGDITYADVLKEDYGQETPTYGYWLIAMDGVYMSTTLVSSSFPAMPDSGTSFIYGPSEHITIINSVLGGQMYGGLLYVDCSLISSMPSVSFVINSVQFVLDPEDYILTYRETGYSDSCVSSFVGSSQFQFYILGDVFMRKFYTIFDMGENRIGFATASPAPGHAVIDLSDDSSPSSVTDDPTSASTVTCVSWSIIIAGVLTTVHTLLRTKL